MFKLPGQALLLKIAGGAVLAFAVLAGVQTWRLHSLQAKHAAVAANNAILADAVGDWQRAHTDQVNAASSWKDVARIRLTLLLAAQKETLRLGNANRDALAKAAAQLAESDRARRVAEDRLRAAKRTTTCGAALAALDTACPTLEGF